MFIKVMVGVLCKPWKEFISEDTTFSCKIQLKALEKEIMNISDVEMLFYYFKATAV